MNYKEPLVKAKICRIFNDMIVDVVLDDGSVSHAFCPEVDFNHQLYSVDRVVYLTKSADKRRKIPYICQMCDVGSSLVFVNYKYKNKLFLEAFHKGILDADFGRFVRVREIEADDLLKMVNFELLSDNGERAFVYVVDIFNKIGDDVVFPSSINFFELEMFEELKRMRAKGADTYVFLIVPREDCKQAKFVWSQDPIAAAKIYDEVQSGLKFCCYSCNVNQKSVSIAQKMNICY